MRHNQYTFHKQQGYKKNLFLYCYALFFILSHLSGYTALAQSPTISYPSVAQDLTRAYSQSNLTVKLVFNGVCTGTNTVRIALPSSVTYVAGTVAKTGGTAGVSIAESSITNLSRPEFSITGIASIGDEITFTVTRRADCGSLATAKDSVYFISGAGCSDASETVGTVNTYNIFAPALSITPATALTGAVIGTTATRTSTVTNGGNGALDTLRFYVVYPGGGIVNTNTNYRITANSVNFDTVRKSGDTLFYKIYGATLFGGDNLLTSGETVTIQEPIRVVKCNTTTTYASGWGRNSATVCQWATGTSVVNMKTGAAALGYVKSDLIGYVNKCTPFESEFTYVNQGTGNDTAGAMYDVLAEIATRGGIYFLAFDTTYMSFSNFRVNGTSVPTVNAIGSGVNRYYQAVVNNAFASDPDGPGGLSDLDGDGYFDDLKIGDTLRLRFDVNIKCNRSCNVDITIYPTAGRIQFHSMCNKSSYSISAQNADADYWIAENQFAGTGYIPANVDDSGPISIRLSEGHYQNISRLNLSTTRYRWKVVLPAGFSVATTPNAKYGTTSVSGYTMSGDTLIYTSTIASLLPFSIDLQLNCALASGGTTRLYYFLEKVNDITAPECLCQAPLVCDSLTTKVFCPGPCPSGISNFIPKVRRADGSLGWTDYTMTTRQTASAISAYDLSKAMYLDTIIVQSRGKQGLVSAANLHLELSLAKGTGGVSKLTPIKAVSGIYRSGVLQATCTITTASLTASTSTQQVIEWDLTSCFSGVSGGLTIGDSIYTEAYYVVATNDALPTIDIQSGGSNIYYNLVGGTTKDYCTTPIAEMYLVGTAAVNGQNAYTASACAAVNLGSSTNNYARRFASAGTQYQNEFRPGMIIDSIVVEMPTSYTDYQFNYFASTGGSSFLLLSPTYTSGNKYTFVNPGWSALNTTVVNNYGSNFRVTVTPTCMTFDGDSIVTKTYIRDYYYAYAGSTTPVGLARVLEGSAGNNRKIIYSETSKPDISLSNLTGTVQGVSSSHSWTVRISNPSLQTAPYVWLAVPDYSGITVTAATNMTSSTTLSPITYTGGKWYQVSTTGIASSGNIDVKLDFTYTTCSLDSLKVYGGWNCSAYPTDPSTYTCGKDSLFLKLDPQASQVQLSVERQPGGGSSINLCTVDSTIIVVNSAQSANLVSPYVTFYPPTGLSLVTPVRVEYPRGSGNYQNATVSSIGGGGYKIDLSAHSGISTNGMLGTANASPGYSPLGGDREARVVVGFSTDCSFSSGSVFYFNAYGNRPCGQPAIGNGIAASTSGLNITGASTTASAGITLSLGGRTSFSCGELLSLNSTVTPTSSPTLAGDTMVYTLPLGITYFPGSLFGTGISTTPLVSGGGLSPQIVKVALNSGTPSGTAVSYTFSCSVNSGGGCSSNQIGASYKRNISGLMCGAIACTNSSVIIATSTSPSFTQTKPTLNITAMSKLDDSAKWVMGGWLNIVKVDYSNTGTYAYSAYTDTIEFYCNSSATTPFYRAPLRKNVAIGASASDTFAINIWGTPCIAGDFVEARIPVVKSNGGYQCLCSPSALSASAPLPLGILAFKAQNNACAVQLTWGYGEETTNKLKTLIVQRSADGEQFDIVSSLPSGVTSYVDVSPYSGQWLYRLRADYHNGRSEYSPTILTHTNSCSENKIEVYPNPVQHHLYIVLQGNTQENSYELIDALGRKVLQGTLEQNHNNQLDVQNLSSGLYMLRIHSGSEVSTQQVHIVR